MDDLKAADSRDEKFRTRIIFYPFIFAIFPIVSLFASNVGQVSPLVLIFTLVATTFVTALAFFLSCLLMRNQEMAALLTCWLVLFFFLYGSFSELIMNLKFGDYVFARNMHRIPVYTLLFLILGYGLLRLQKQWRQLTRLLNILSAWLLLIMGLTLAWKYAVSAGRPAGELASVPSRKESLLNIETAPDIYYIILDGYAGAATLSKFFGYDNLPFIQYLRDKGFYIPKRARSNYAMTVLSLASSLGMDYWQKEGSVRMPVNKVKPFVEQAGYEYISFSSMNPPIRRQSENGYSLRGLLYNAFTLKLVRTSVIDAVAMRFKFYSANLRGNVLDSLEQLKNIPESSGRKFIFAHILSPHPPYIFKANGEAADAFSDASLNIYKTPWDDRAGYVEQLRFINSQIRLAIETILQKSKTLPIIVLQGDHGPALSIPEQSTAAEAGMNILNAYYLPGEGSSKLYEAITPVNSFRVILNYYLHADLPLLEDKSYYSTLQRPLKFFDVTEPRR